MVTYLAKVWSEGKHWLAEFPDAPGCQTFADSRAELPAVAREALEGWLEAHLERGGVPMKPKARHAEGIHIDVDPKLAIALTLRWARTDRGLTQGDLARLAGVTQQQIAKLESGMANPSIETLNRIGDALGMRANVSFVPVEAVGGRRRRAR